jgi:hypothetical protein
MTRVNMMEMDEAQVQRFYFIPYERFNAQSVSHCHRQQLHIVVQPHTMTILGLLENGTSRHFRFPCSTTPIPLDHVEYEDSSMTHMCERTRRSVTRLTEPWLSHLVRAR